MSFKPFARRFDRNQLEFVTQVIFEGAADQVQSCLPPVISQGEYKARKGMIDNYLQGIINTVGIQLPILYAQLTDDGMGAGDFRQFHEFESLVWKYVKQQAGDAPDQTGTMPDLSSLAVEFVNEFFADYLKGND